MEKTIRQKLLGIAHKRIAITLGISGKELVDLSDCSPTTALSVINEIISRHPNLLKKTSRRWSVTCPDDIPYEWLADFSIANALSEGKMKESAILGSDVAISKVRFTVRNSVADKAIIMSVRASRYRKAGVYQRGAIRINYVGLRLDEQAKWRTIIPLTLEEFSGKWRIIGIDTDKNKSRTFQLSRIIDVDETLHPIPSAINAYGTYSPKRRVSITLSDRLTDDQRIAVKNELGLSNKEFLQLTEGQLHDMRHQYGIDKPNDQIVWPVVKTVEVL